MFGGITFKFPQTDSPIILQISFEIAYWKKIFPSHKVFSRVFPKYAVLPT